MGVCASVPHERGPSPASCPLPRLLQSTSTPHRARRPLSVSRAVSNVIGNHRNVNLVAAFGARLPVLPGRLRTTPTPLVGDRNGGGLWPARPRRSCCVVGVVHL